MELVSVRSVAIDGPDEIIVKAVATLDVGLKELQERLIQQDIDPLHPKSLKILMPLLKEYLDFSPFTTEKINLSSVCQESVTVVAELKVTVKNEIRDLEGLRKKYEKMLVETIGAH